MRETLRHLRKTLTPRFGRGETEAIIRLIFHHLKGWDTTGIIINEDKPLSEYITSKIDDIVRRLLAGEPIQYITGEAYFYGMDLKVTPDVLIPRVETQQLVDLIADSYRRRDDLHVLDVGTGSGCIAIALSRNLPFSHVSALDISSRALDVAKENAENMKADIDFIHADIFSYTPPDAAFDIIVSNPPYVTASERADMETNVLDHEPWSALFVPDDDPLRFYRRIAGIGKKALKPGGSLWFELNSHFADDTARMVSALGYADTDIQLDIAGRPRFLSCRLPEDNG